MPFTPFHFGPGAAIHAVAPKKVSFIAFCAANVLMDVEPLYYMVTHQYPLHRFFHTYIGATIVMITTALIIFTALRLASRLTLPDIFQWQSLKHLPIWLGAAVGSYSHIVLDSIMHADIVTLSPFSEVNVLYRTIPLNQLHNYCLYAGFFGLVILGIRHLLKTNNHAE